MYFLFDVGYILRPYWGSGGEKRIQKTVQKKVPRQTQTGSYSQARRLPGSPPRVRGFLNNNQPSEQETTIVAHFWIHIRAFFLESMISESISRKLLFSEIWDNKRKVIAEGVAWFGSRFPFLGIFFDEMCVSLSLSIFHFLLANMRHTSHCGCFCLFPFSKCQGHIANYLTRPGQRPGIFLHVKIGLGTIWGSKTICTIKEVL